MGNESYVIELEFDDKEEAEKILGFLDDRGIRPKTAYTKKITTLLDAFR